MNPILLAVKKTITKYEMLQPGERVLVGVSGGPDSVALLHVLFELRREFHISLIAAYLDHGLRPEAKAERSFVQMVSRKLGIPFVGRKVNVPELQKKEHLSMQEAAREIRYSFFVEAASGRKASKIALGHTADDQAESVVMRLLRGTGTRGLSGIPPVRDGLFIRPLIEVWRKDIEAFLTERKIPYLTDTSNQSWKYLRNRVRQELMPVLQWYNPRIRQNLVQMADLFRAEEKFWEKILEEKFPSVLKTRKKNSLILDIPSLSELPFPLRLRCFRYTIEETLGHLRRVSLGSILTIESFLKSPDPNKCLMLPNGLCVTKAYNSLSFTKAPRVIPPFEYSVSGPGFVEIPEIGHGMEFDIQIRENENRIEESASVAHLDFEDTDFPLTVRSFHPGDRFQPLGMEGEKKVKDFFIDCKIAAEQRKRIPLLFKGERLLWVGGIRIDHRARLKPETRRVLRVELI